MAKHAAMMRPRARSILAGALAVCAVVAGFNLVADPFGAFRLVDRTGFNAAKPGLEHRVKLAKAYDLRRRRPEAIVLGTSRSHIAIRTTHVGWGVPPKEVYNAAFDGATTREMYSYLRHAQAIRPLKQVALGLDTWHLEGGPAWVRPDFDPSLLYIPSAPLHNLGVLAADLRLLINVDTLRASLVTLQSQGASATDWLAQDGQRLGPVFFHDFEPEFVAGPGDYLRSVDRQEIGYHLDTTPAPARTAPSRDKRTSLDYVAAIVDFCRKNDIDLRIFLTPAHAHQLEIAWALGEWPAIESGKRRLVAILARDAARHPGGRRFRLYDFSGYSPVTTETVPPPGSRKEMRFYWDSSHFKELVGDWVLDRLFGVETNSVPKSFGVELTPETIDAALARDRRAHEIYRRAHQEDIETLMKMIADVRTQQKRVAKFSSPDSRG